MNKKDKELIRDRIEQLRYLQNEYILGITPFVPLLTFAFSLLATSMLFYAGRIDSRNPNTIIINLYQMVKILEITLVFIVSFYLIAFFIFKKYDLRIKKNYLLLIEGKK